MRFLTEGMNVNFLHLNTPQLHIGNMQNCKLGVPKGVAYRAHLLCDIKEDLLNELELLRNVFICNFYPKKAC